MRITKVKIGYDMVLMHRTNTKGILVLGDKTKTDKTKDILPNEKRKSFELSVQNKTVVEKVQSRSNKIKPKREISKEISKIVKELVKIKDINSDIKLPKLEKCNLDDIAPYLGHKFKQDVKYKDNNNIIYSFNLANIIHEYSKENNANVFKPYIIWKEWYIKNKSNNLIKSINNNVIDNIANTNMSPRKEALKDWEDEYVREGKVRLDELVALYNIGDLAHKLNDYKSNDGKKYKDSFNLHRALKQALQEHQKTVFGRNNEVTPIEEKDKFKRNRTNNKLCVYHLEIVKYLEHYFPIKSTKRKNSNNDINYYLEENTIKLTVRSQIENAIMANLLQQGKVAHHNLNQNTISNLWCI